MSEVTLGKSLEQAIHELERRARLFGPNHPATLNADIEATRLSLESKAGLVDRSAAELYPDDTAQLLAREEGVVRRKLSANGTS